MDQGNAPSNTGEYAMQKRRKKTDASNVGQASGLREEVAHASLLGATKGGYKETTSGKTTSVITDFRNGMELPAIRRPGAATEVRARRNSILAKLI